MTVRSGELVGPRRLVQRLNDIADPVFSICTLVTRWDDYDEMYRSFHRRGFGDGYCEFLVLDNSARSVADAYVGLNEFLQAARGRYVILCHQDIELIEADRTGLEGMLRVLDDLDPGWALCGNAGHAADGKPHLYLSHPHDDRHITGGPFPARVVSLDENFIVVRRMANLALSRDLHGFHHYGADLCTIADVLGWSSYVIAFFLRHKSGGNIDESYRHSAQRIAIKYQRAFRSRSVALVTLKPLYLSGSRLKRAIATTIHRVLAKLESMMVKLKRRLLPLSVRR